MDEKKRRGDAQEGKLASALAFAREGRGRMTTGGTVDI